MVRKWENLEPEEIINNYVRLKEDQRKKNAEAYKKLKEQPKKYYKFLNQVSENQKIRIENIKADPELFEQYKEQKKIYNSNYYYNKQLEKYNESLQLLTKDDTV